MQDASQHRDYELMSRFALGHRDAFDQVYNEFSARLYHFARRFVEQEAEAEDIAADAFIKLWVKKGDFPTLDTIAVFLHKTVRNRCLDYLKHEQVKQKKKEELIRLLESTPEADFSHELVMMKLMEKIYREVDKLPAKMRTIFYLSYKEGLKPAQIAAKLDLSVQTVKNQRVSAMKLLKAAIKDQVAIALLIQLTNS